MCCGLIDMQTFKHPKESGNKTLLNLVPLKPLSDSNLCGQMFHFLDDTGSRSLSIT